MNSSLDHINRIVNRVIQHHQLPDQVLTKYSSGSNHVFAYGDDLVIKTYAPGYMEEREIEVAVLKHLSNQLQIQIPTVLHHGIMEEVPYLMMTQVHGHGLDNVWEELDYHNKLHLIKELGATIASVHQLPVQGLPDIYMNWHLFIEKQMEQCVDRHRKQGLKETLLQEIPEYIEAYKHLLPSEFRPVLLTGEYNPFNLLVNRVKDQWKLTGMIDFADCMIGFHEYDLLGPAVFMVCGDRELMRVLLLSYGYQEEELHDELKKRLMLLLLLHRYSHLKAQIRIEGWEEQVNSLAELEELLWCF